MDPASLGGSAAALFRTANPLSRAKARYRPHICPLHILLPLVPTGSRVLDAGCGNGLLLGLLATTGRIREGTGYDISPAAIAQARSMALSLATVPLTFHECADADALPPGQFDAVTIVDVLHHVPPPQQQGFFLHAAARVAPGGVLIYKDMVGYPDWRAWTNAVHDIVLAGHASRYTPVSRVEQWAADAHLEKRDGGRHDMLWYGHELRVFQRTA